MRGLRRFVNVPRELGYNAGMKSKLKAIGYNLLVIVCAIMFVVAVAAFFEFVIGVRTLRIF